MKKISIILGISLVCGLAFINTNSLKHQDLASVDLSSIMQVAQAGPEGCITTPGSNTGSCYKNVDGTNWNCIANSIQLDCSSD